MNELIIGNIYKCKDGSLRKLEKIEDKLLYYSVPIDTVKINVFNEYVWLSLSGTYRKQIEEEFIKGIMCKNGGSLK